MILHKSLPPGSGVGSSSSSIVAALVALNALAGRPLGGDELLALAAESEGAAAGARHRDNVAPCLLGGMRLIAPDGVPAALPWPEELLFVLLLPERPLATRAARAVLPAAVPLADAVSHAQNLARLVHALHADDRDALRASLRDGLAEPARAPLVPGFRAVQRAALASGALGCSFSGAGPAIFAVADSRDRADRVAEAMRAAWPAEGGEARTRVCRIDPAGARLLAGEAGPEVRRCA